MEGHLMSGPSTAVSTSITMPAILEFPMLMYSNSAGFLITFSRSTIALYRFSDADSMNVPPRIFSAQTQAWHPRDFRKRAEEWVSSSVILAASMLPNCNFQAQSRASTVVFDSQSHAFWAHHRKKPNDICCSSVFRHANRGLKQRLIHPTTQ
jgi:hypothetical protein